MKAAGMGGVFTMSQKLYNIVSTSLSKKNLKYREAIQTPITEKKPEARKYSGFEYVFIVAN